MYCVKCRKITESQKYYHYITPNLKNLMVGVCSECGFLKSKFIKKSDGENLELLSADDFNKLRYDSKKFKGKGVVNNLLNLGSKVMPEMHLPGYNYCGPFTNLDKRLPRGDKGINKLDEGCKLHDIAYNTHKDGTGRKLADQALITVAKDVISDPNTSLLDRMDARLVKGIIGTKKLIGQGNKKRKRKKK